MVNIVSKRSSYKLREQRDHWFTEKGTAAYL